MKFIAACLALLLLAPAFAQAPKSDARESALDRAILRCIENRGADCESRDGLKEWLRQERPLTPEEQAAAAGARKHRETCAGNKKAAGC